MAYVVFLRGVNVGGRRRFRPAALAREMAALGTVNVGAAGTFVVRKGTGPPSVRDAFTGRLPFETKLIVVPAAEIVELVDRDPFGFERVVEGAKPYVSILAGPPRASPRFPIEKPPGEEWEVRVRGLWGRYVLSLHRRLGERIIYPNEVVEKSLDQAATTRGWSTITAVRQLLEPKQRTT